MITKTDLREQPVTQVGASRLFRTRRASAAAVQAYSEIDLSGAAARSDFDAGTVAIVAGIVTFKLLMLSVLFVAL